ncbi:MAG: GNAT family N-acetyltransferase [Clostridiales bacterium]|nr:GNAT family N-acetyltransferase [Clostridiales bacterium]
MYEFRNLENVGLDDITDTWNRAFSDYVVPLEMTLESVDAYLKVTGVDRRQSYGTFCGGELVGLLLNSVDTFRGSLAAYDAMTGIVPEHRGRGLFSQMFEYTRDSLKAGGITHYYLEVITTNERARSIYTKKGGKILRELAFVKGRVSGDAASCGGALVGGARSDDAPAGFAVKTLPLSEFISKFPLDLTSDSASEFPSEELCNYEPTFGNRLRSLYRNIADYNVAYINEDSKKTAVVYSSAGRIPQIVFGGAGGGAGAATDADADAGTATSANVVARADAKHSLHAILAHLSGMFETLSISNIPTTETALISELQNLGLAISVKQYEMCIEL